MATLNISSPPAALRPSQPTNRDIRIIPVLFVLHGVLGMSIIILNSFLIFVFCRRRPLRSVGSALMVLLAFADQGVGCVLLVPLLHSSWNLHIKQLHCNLIGYFFSTSFSSSLYSILLLSLDRLVFILHPLRYKYICSKRLVGIGVVACWLFCYGFWLFPVLGVGSFHFEQNCVMCMFNWARHPVQWVIYVICLFFGPTLVTGTCYHSVWKISRFHEAGSIRGAEPSQRKASRRSMRTDGKALRTVLVIVGVFYVSWVPFISVSIFEAVQGWVLYGWVHTTMHFFAAINSLWNPLIYIGTNRKFRAAAKELLVACCKRSSPASPTMRPLALEMSALSSERRFVTGEI
ncbi:hypothetical protein CAPTEDRAFT_187612 [Capitella teleta]|uniref:G-protein coupled receptors family 1 profile domain-containing protein n=1 Tax=Capitella teleta TaxID=283909 RepID=R7UK28_CAPTE|nr:hypothetical protein CAPTEDRAFT_187612 [Capitella teleta]|eukprot:ELU04153.1 hypothetical protein CAPTEDRAFT_187612 [Capitella teleta]